MKFSTKIIVMGNIEKIIQAIDIQLIQKNKPYMLLTEANRLLTSTRLIADNKALKKIVESGLIPHAYQTLKSPKQWRIPLSEKGKAEKEKLDKRNQKQTSKPTNDQREKKTYTEILFITIVIISMVLVNVNPTDDCPSVQNSGLDASVHQQVEQFLDDHLKYPDSYESIEWSPVQKTENGYYYVRHKYRARNEFGEMKIKNHIFYLDENGNVISTDYDY